MEQATYAVGDVHGCAALLRELLERIETHAEGRPYDLIMLGDYIDKGPDSAAVLDLLMDLQTKPIAGRVICLAGNHEAELIASLTDDHAFVKWLEMGGGTVLDEFGVRSPDRLPRAVLDWIAALPTWHETPYHYFVHAGLDPERRRDQQTDKARLAMRGAFLTRDHDFGRHVVHGHTPRTSGVPETRRFRTNVDTSAFSTGILTAAFFAAGSSRPSDFLQTGRDAPVK